MKPVRIPAQSQGHGRPRAEWLNVCDSDIGLILTRSFTSTCIDSECSSFQLCNVAAVVLEMAWKRLIPFSSSGITLSWRPACMYTHTRMHVCSSDTMLPALIIRISVNGMRRRGEPRPSPLLMDLIDYRNHCL